MKKTAYILFLDLQGFSKLTNKEQLDLVEALYKETASLLERCGERILDSKTVGDSFIVYFEEQMECLDTAVKIRTLFQENFFWEKNEIPKVKCRIALHTGELYILKDYIEKRSSIFGKSITTAARLEPIVRLNEIWCTASFYHAIHDKDGINVKYLFKKIGNASLAKDYAEMEVYALFRKGDQEPSMIQHESKVIKQKLDPKDFSYLLFLRLRKRDTSIDSIVSAFKPFDCSVDAVYYIYGIYDVLLKVRFKKEVTKTAIEQQLQDKRRKIIKKEQGSTLFLHIGSVYSGHDEEKFQLIENNGEYNVHTFLFSDRPLKDFKSFIYLRSSEISKDKEGIGELAGIIRSKIEDKKNFLNIYINNNSLIIEVVLKTSAYYLLSQLVEAMEEFCERKDWDIAKSITYPVHGFEEFPS